jgi:serine/threonine protein kinase
MGKKFGKYILQKRIASGGMGEIYLAQKQGPQGFTMSVAIKMILPYLSKNEKFAQMFFNEAKLVAQLNHPNIARIYDFGKVLDTYYIDMEYIQGENLATIIDELIRQGSRFPYEYAANIGISLCKGLDYAHNKLDDISGEPLNIIHRDISPQNVLISYEGEVKIIDFGIAKRKDDQSSKLGALKGKYAYMSPEQVIGGQLDRRSDIFSLGVVLYEMVTGATPFLQGSDFKTLEAIQNATYRPIGDSREDVDRKFEFIIKKALSKEPEYRYKSARAMRFALENYLRENYSTPSTLDLASFIKIVLEDRINAAEVSNSYEVAAEDFDDNPPDLDPDQQHQTYPGSKSALPSEHASDEAEMLPERQESPLIDYSTRRYSPDQENRLEKKRDTRTKPNNVIALMRMSGEIPLRQKITAVSVILFVFVITLVAGVFALHQFMVRQNHTLLVTANQSDVSIMINNEFYGKTGRDGQAKIYNIPTGRDNTAKFIKPCYKEVSNSFRSVKQGLSKLTVKMEPDYGSIKVFSVPAQAKVIFNGQSQTLKDELGNPLMAVTPLVIHSVQLCIDHELVLIKPGYHEWKQTVRLEEPKQQEIRITLKDEKFLTTGGGVKITTNPDGCDIYLDHNLLEQKSPIDLLRLEPDKIYEIRAAKSGYQDVIEKISVEEGLIRNLNLELLRQYGYLTIYTDPPCDILLDGKDYGRTSNERELKLPVAKYQLILRRRDLDLSYEKEIEVEYNTHKRMQKRFPGFLSVTSADNREAEVFIDGQSLGLTPIQKTELEQGPHTLLIKSRGLSKEVVLNLKPGKPINVSVKISDAGLVVLH